MVGLKYLQFNEVKMKISEIKGFFKEPLCYDYVRESLFPRVNFPKFVYENPAATIIFIEKAINEHLEECSFEEADGFLCGIRKFALYGRRFHCGLIKEGMFVHFDTFVEKKIVTQTPEEIENTIYTDFKYYKIRK